MKRTIKKPILGEYPQYSHIYLDLMEDNGKVLEHLENNIKTIKDYVYDLPEETLYYRYAPGKWTIKEILVHLIDDERIFCYRALRYARNDQTSLPGFEENEYAKFSQANARSLDSIFDEYEAVRLATLKFFEHLPEEALTRSGTGLDENGNIVNRRTVRGLAYHIAGHELRHFNIIKERYVKASIGTSMP